MIFGGMQKNSFIDFPGKISTVLFLRGCNLKCPYCHNPALVDPGEEAIRPIGDDEVFSFLKTRRGLIDGVAITGGEPTLQPELPALIRRIRALGFPVKLDTNGTRPAMLARLMEQGLLDFVAMDIKTDPSAYMPRLSKEDVSQEILESIDRIRTGGIPHEFRTTCVRPFVNLEAIRTIARLVEGADTHALQRFSPAHVLDPEFFHSENRLIPDEDLLAFQEILSRHVRKCVIR